MAPFLLLLNATKVIGAAGIIAVAVDSVAYRRYRKRNLTPFENPLDETEEILARFEIEEDVEDGGFFFALATAPAHVEDKLKDAWLEFAEQSDGKQSSATGHPEIRDEKAESVGISLVEELQAAKLNEARDERAKEDAEVVKGESKPESSEEGDESEKLVETSKADKTVSPETPTGAALSEWEVVSEGSEKGRYSRSPSAEREEKLDISTGKDQDERASSAPEMQLEDAPPPFPADMESLPSQSDILKRRAKGSTSSPTLVNLPQKTKQLAKVAMEAMIRGIQKITEEEETANVAAWQNAFHPEERLRFWTEPDTELKLAKDANVSVFRMGVDWSRIMPVEPLNGMTSAVNWGAVKRYRQIIERVRDHGMKVMLTLFHHSLPIWAAKYGGWKEPKTVKYFVDFTRLVVDQYADLVDYWITFNEPHVFTMLTYCAGAWPGGDPNLLETATAVFPKGVFKVVMAAMADAHIQAYDIIHANSKKISKRTKVGVAHHVSFMRPYGLFDVPLVMFSDHFTRFAYVDDVCKKLDYLGINYYGQEVISAPGLKLVENDEYSESGRGVYPDGLYRILIDFHNRYKKYNIPYIITENGVSDSSDYIRRPYIIEHLLALRAAMSQGVPVRGYCFWTTSDNWEWADGYGPKFGLVAVDRHHNLERIPRQSYYLFSEIAKTGYVTKEQREKAWRELQEVAEEGKKRPFCRSVDEKGLMYSGGLDIPIERPFVSRDWRFGHYEMDGLQDPVSRFFRFIVSGAFLGLRQAPRKARGGIPKSKEPTGMDYKGVPDVRFAEMQERATAAA
ncbi:galactolipid galactosyltransferase [Marchantia polymorpha subsp. ruderalis]|uniref:Uncharacterized protein n=2 Tax=Marchantia polymorpha TaxID=3197 RepID=A0A176VH96_MARPO|nr:hypothetical protein AXG93_4888s1070 [Marchantia polymorpha subsp. ruderalis]PTQ32879.1 hypothetical protein MARPO_0094s0053 [Marchantia polymorpha]BBN02752.1 hypothetical protein Mp_2g17840 [Marchantia polymorpha subsp. ruderalis]|eukprot:PTQ32879.1 hypothetical protein MARPO_0094s0053 [Marchantia polymorpha]